MVSTPTKSLPPKLREWAGQPGGLEVRGWGRCPPTEAVWPAPRPETAVSTRGHDLGPAPLDRPAEVRPNGRAASTRATHVWSPSWDARDRRGTCLDNRVVAQKGGPLSSPMTAWRRAEQGAPAPELGSFIRSFVAHGELGSLDLGTDLEDGPLSSPVITEYQFVHRDDTLGDLPAEEEGPAGAERRARLEVRGWAGAHHRGGLGSPSTRDHGKRT